MLGTLPRNIQQSFLEPFPQPQLNFLHKLYGLNPGFVFLAARDKQGLWREKCFHSLFGQSGMEAFLNQHDPLTHDLYFCPNSFTRRRRLARHAHSTRFAWCDIDEGDPSAFRPKPTILWETSPGRHQGLWIFEHEATPEAAEATSRYLTNAFGGDRGGWSITKYLRLPGTLNHKAAYDRPEVRLKHYSANTLLEWPKTSAPENNGRGNREIDPFHVERASVFRKYKSLVAPNRLRLMQDDSVVSRDRSRAIFMIVTALHEAGASPDEIARVVWESPYFLSKHGSNIRALNTEISRILSKVAKHD